MTHASTIADAVESTIRRICAVIASPAARDLGSPWCKSTRAARHGGISHRVTEPQRNKKNLCGSVSLWRDALCLAGRTEFAAACYGSRVQRATIRLASAPGTQIATTFAPAAPVLWRTLSGGFTYPAIPGFRISLLPLTTCSSSPDTT